MRAVVTGGAGFIGSHLVDALVARGDGVLVVDDLSREKAEQMDERVELLRLDGREIHRSSLDRSRAAEILDWSQRITLAEGLRLTWEEGS